MTCCARLWPGWADASSGLVVESREPFTSVEDDARRARPLAAGLHPAAGGSRCGPLGSLQGRAVSALHACCYCTGFKWMLSCLPPLLIPSGFLALSSMKMFCVPQDISPANATVAPLPSQPASGAPTIPHVAFPHCLACLPVTPVGRPLAHAIVLHTSASSARHSSCSWDSACPKSHSDRLVP